MAKPGLDVITKKVVSFIKEKKPYGTSYLWRIHSISQKPTVLHEDH